MAQLFKFFSYTERYFVLISYFYTQKQGNIPSISII